jgi:hypothetical protein
MSDFNLKGADLKKILGVAKKGPLAFGFNPGKTEAETFFGMHRIKAPKVLGKAAKDEGSGKKFSFGTARVEGKTIFFDLRARAAADGKKPETLPEISKNHAECRGSGRRRQHAGIR